MGKRMLVPCVALLLASCSATTWKLAASGYSIIPGPNSGEFAIAVHLNQLKDLGGDVKSPSFRLFVAKHLEWEGVCAHGWEPLPCADDGWCVSRGRHSVTVYGRCVAP